MRVFLAVAMIALLANSAYAQFQGANKEKTDDQPKSQAAIRAEKEADRAYKQSLSNIPEKGPGDPWGTVRAPDAPKAAPKTPTAKSKVNAKTGAAPN